MKYFVFGIKDTATQIFAQPFYAPAEAAATRSVKDLVNGEGNMIAQHPEDYELYHLGMFDDGTGSLEPCLPRLVTRCKDLARVVS